MCQPFKSLLYFYENAEFDNSRYISLNHITDFVFFYDFFDLFRARRAFFRKDQFFFFRLKIEYRDGEGFADKFFQLVGNFFFVAALDSGIVGGF